ncbi:MAG TPA: hypothetical protein DEP04_00980 [Dehalococcoidia bacterium]|nr:hypothetical protein [Dehalococcoidia bacterium]
MARTLRPEPYNPDAVDADNDGIVQEGTAFERPAGTRLLNRAGQALQRGMESVLPVEGIQVVDAQGRTIPYAPSWLGTLDVEEPTQGLPTLANRGVRNVGTLTVGLGKPQKIGNSRVQLRERAPRMEPVRYAEEAVRSPVKPWGEDPPRSNTGDVEVDEIVDQVMMNRDGGMTRLIQALLHQDDDAGIEAGREIHAGDDYELDMDPIKYEQLDAIRDELRKRTQEFLADFDEEITVYRFGSRRPESDVVSFTLNPRYNYQGALGWAERYEELGERFLPYKVRKSDVMFAMDMRNGPPLGEDEILINFDNVLLDEALVGTIDWQQVEEPVEKLSSLKDQGISTIGS